MVIECAWRTRRQLPDCWIFWVHAADATLFERSYREIADQLDLAGRHDPTTNVMDLVYQWFLRRESRPWLLIMDNLDDGAYLFDRRTIATSRPPHSDDKTCKTLKSYIPFISEHGCILITSRNRGLARTLVEETEIITVEAMSKTESVRLLERQLVFPSGKNGLGELAEALDCMPLALVQAAAYINRRKGRCSVLQYLKKLNNNRKDNLSLLNHEGGQLRRTEAAKNCIITTWQISFDYINRTQPTAAMLLSFMSFCNPRSIPSFLLEKSGYHEGASKPFNSNISVTSDEDQLEQDVQVLEDFAIIAVVDSDAQQFGKPGEARFRMHSLCQRTTQDWLEKHREFDIWKLRYIQVLAQAFPNNEVENWPVCQAILPHAYSAVACELTEDQKIEIGPWLALLRERMTLFAFAKGDTVRALELAVQSSNVQDSFFGLRSKESITGHCLVAAAWRLLGQHSQAEKILRPLLEVATQALGPDDPLTLRIGMTLALSLQFLDRWQDSEVLACEAMELCKGTFGPGSWQLRITEGALAEIYWRQRRWDEAEELLVSLIRSSKKEYMKGNTEIFSYLNMLADTYVGQNREQEAEQLIRRALGVQARISGQEHPDTIMLQGKHAWLLWKCDREEEAVKLMEDGWNTARQVYQETHPDLLQLQARLGLFYSGRGHYKAAERLLLSAEEKLTQTLGPDHTDTADIAYYTAWHYKAQSMRLEAIAWLTRCVESSLKTLGKEHVLTRERSEMLQEWLDDKELDDVQQSSDSDRSEDVDQSDNLHRNGEDNGMVQVSGSDEPRNAQLEKTSQSNEDDESRAVEALHGQMDSLRIYNRSGIGTHRGVRYWTPMPLISLIPLLQVPLPSPAAQPPHHRRTTSHHPPTHSIPQSPGPD